MAKRHKHPERTAPVRLAPPDRFTVNLLAGKTGWTYAKALATLLRVGAMHLRGDDTAARHAKKYVDTAEALHDAESRAEEKLAPKRAAVRAAANLIKLTGPDIADSSEIGKEK